jgi:hypothetical protein
MDSEDSPSGRILDYSDRNVWTTWSISYQAIRTKHEHTANLLLLWSFLDNKTLWYDLLAASYSREDANSSMLSDCVD